MSVLDHHNARGFTKWELTAGRGSEDGEPHYATHTWPARNSSILSIVPDHRVKPILDALRELDHQLPNHGLRAFVWEVVDQI